MPDYGRPISFGTFITPTNADPTAPVGLAQLSERVGLDLVTFQDHPYQPRFLDTWTLLSWVAARTERIHLSGNVLNIQLRPPAVLARAAISLDLLSGGRFELGLGAGGFADAVAAMGAPRLTAGESVDALSEAIDVIRGVWDTDNRSPLVVDGTHHKVRGAKRGPAPAHEIPIWLGAYKRRMLRLIANKADGWVPSIAMVPREVIAEGIRIIDEAAEEAGRSPKEIRRLYNVAGRFSPASGGMLDGPTDQWVEQLTELALDDGADTFILASDDATMIERFAGEVAPAVREAVERERAARGTSTGLERTAKALAARRPGIDYDGVPASLTSSAVEPGDFGYANVRSTYLRGGSPGLVLRPSTEEEVAEAVAYAGRHAVPVAIRSSGHGMSGRSTNDGGIVIDVGSLNTIDIIDEAERIVAVGPGATWAEVARALQPHGWAISSGDYGGVGVGGLATAGGIGFLSRAHGLTIDHVRSVRVVLADSSVVSASDSENPDLYWAIRGAGANFGIATSFTMRADPVPAVGVARFIFDMSDTAAALTAWGAAISEAPRSLTGFLTIGRTNPGQTRYAHATVVVDSPDPDYVRETLAPVTAVAPVLGSRAEITSYADLMDNAAPGAGVATGEPAIRSGLAAAITPDLAAAAAKLLDSGESYFFQIRALGGATSDVEPDATAFAHRDANFSIISFGADAARLDDAWDALEPHFKGLYLSFDTRLGPDIIVRAFPPDALERLREIKRRYDPTNFFRDNFNITP